MSNHVVTYDRARFPKQPRLTDGKWGCRGCGGPLSGRRTAWCSNACADRWHPTRVLRAVKRRDKDVCSLCGFDCKTARHEWHMRLCELGYQPHYSWAKGCPPKPPGAEYDHIVPFSEGGLTVLENMRTLCRPCHVKVTAEWRRSKRRPTP